MKLKALRWWLICALCMILWACDTTVEPLDEEIGIFAIYGVLDLNEETNYIRVRDLNSPFTAEATQELDAVVTIENLTNNTAATLDSQILESAGIFHHNFLVHGQIQPNATYYLTVERSDGVTVEVQAVTPTKPEPVITPANPDCFTPVTVEMNPINGVLVYAIGINLGIPRFTNSRIFRSSGDHPEKLSFTFTLDEVVAEVGFFNTPDCEELNFNQYTIIYRHYGPGFYEKIENDPFDILQSTERFGGYYFERLVLPAIIQGN